MERALRFVVELADRREPYSNPGRGLIVEKLVGQKDKACFGGAKLILVGKGEGK